MSVLNLYNREETEKLLYKANTLDSIIVVLKNLFFNSESTSAYGVKLKGKKAREKLNTACKEILSRVNLASELTQEEKEILLQYSGRGGLTENSQFEYYTPSHLAEGMWDAMKANGFENGNVLDPCCGAGVFSGTKPKGIVISANDLDPTASKVAQLLNEGDFITNEPFERKVMNTPDNTYDSCIANVPFGMGRGAHKHEDPQYANEKHIEKYFILRILDKIKPNALACLICPINILNAKGKKWEEFRIAVSKKAEFLGAHKLPSKTFKNQGTSTVVDVLIFKKHSSHFLDEVHELAFDTLSEANVIFDEFIKGKYWQGEGKPFIMGKYFPKVAGDRWSREIVDGKVDNATMKNNLAKKFNSRINWDLLNTAEPITRNYAEGDQRSINGIMYIYEKGEWNSVSSSREESSIDHTKYGAETFAELKDKLATAYNALSFSYTELEEIYNAFPDILSNITKEAIKFAYEQAKCTLERKIQKTN